MVKVLFVCLGNICRSPTAHGVFEGLVHSRGLADAIHVDSAGTGDWHIGHAPDPRSVEVATSRGVDISHLRASQVNGGQFDQYDYILAMDKQNLADLEAMRPSSYQGHLSLFLDFDGSHHSEVPDPYYGGAEGFQTVIGLIESASEGLLAEICQVHQLTAGNR